MILSFANIGYCALCANMSAMTCTTPSDVSWASASADVAGAVVASLDDGVPPSLSVPLMLLAALGFGGREAKTARMQLTYIRAISNRMAGSSVRLCTAKREGVAEGRDKKVWTLDTAG